MNIDNSDGLSVSFGATNNPIVERLLTIIPAWDRSLRARQQSPGTIHTYTLAAQQLHDYWEREGFPTGPTEISTDSIRGFLGDMLARRSSSMAAQPTEACSNASSG